MKKTFKLVTVGFFALFIIEGVFADSPANGRFGETNGTCIVNGRNFHYWMYDTYSDELKNLTHSSDLFSENVFIPLFISYAEKLGWTIDYDNARKYDPNNNLATSVKKMMQTGGLRTGDIQNPFYQGATVSMTVMANGENSATLIINFWNDMKENHWWTYEIPLVR
jgi:hypothetical protein